MRLNRAMAGNPIIMVLFLLCVVCLVGCHERNKIYFLALAPFPDERPGFDPTYDGGPSILPAVRLAVEHINSNTSLLRDYELDFTMEDSGCAQTSKATIAFARGVLHSAVSISGIIGPACSDSAQAVGFLGGMNTTSVVQIAIATSPALNDAQYSNTFRALSSSLVYVKVFLGLIALNKWERVGALYDAEVLLFRSTHFEFVGRLQENNFTGLKFSSPVSDTLLPDEEIVNQAKVVFVFARSKFARILLCYAWHFRLTFPSLQWIFHDRFRDDFAHNVSFSYRGTVYKCNKNEMARASDGVILNVYALKTQYPDNITDAGLSYNEYIDQYKHELEISQPPESNTTFEPDLYANVYYDAVWSFALSLNASLSVLGRNSITSRKDDVTHEVRKHLQGFHFVGMSGTVWFDEFTLASNSSVINISRLEYSNAREDSRVMLSVLYDPAVPNPFTGSDFPPGTFIRDELSEVVHIPLGLGIFSLIVFSVIAVVTGALHVINFIWSDYKTVKANSPRMNNLIFSGCYVVSISGLLFTIQRTFLSSDHPVGYSILCNIVFTWCNTISFSLIFGTICAKSWRIYRIFTVFTSRQYLISDKLLISFVLLLLVLDMILIFTWNFVDPWTIQTVRSGDEVEVGCTCEYLGIWVATTFIYKGALLVAVVALAILTRRVHRREFKYSKSTNTFVYSLIIVTVVLLPLNRIFDIPLLSFLVFIVYQAIIVILSLVFLLLPSVWPLLKHYFHTIYIKHSSYNRSIS